MDVFGTGVLSWQAANVNNIRVGVFVDAENSPYNGGYQLWNDILRRFAARNDVALLRLDIYLAFNAERIRVDQEYAHRTYAYRNTLRDFVWRVITRTVECYTDQQGNLTTGANADLDLAVGAMLMPRTWTKSC
jgi:hypothetical protein